VRRIKAEAIKASRDAQEKARQAALEKRILEEEKKRAARKQQGGLSEEGATGAGGRPWTAGSNTSATRRNDFGGKTVGDEGEGSWADAIDALKQDEVSMTRKADAGGGSPSKNSSPMPSTVSSPGWTPSRRKRGTGRMSEEEKEAMERRWGVGGVDEEEDTGHGEGDAVEEGRVDGEEKDEKDEIYSLLTGGVGEGKEVMGSHEAVPLHVPLERGWSDDEHSQVGPHFIETLHPDLSTWPSCHLPVALICTGPTTVATFVPRATPTGEMNPRH